MGARTILSIGLSVGAVGAVVAGGLAVSSFLAGGGTQPEDVLPASTIAFAKVDLNPSAGQKLNVLRLMRKFPELETESEDLKATAVEAILDEADLGLKYEADIAPWLGDRAAVAVVPSPKADEGFAPLVVLEVTDQEAMAAALDKAERKLVLEREEMWASAGGSDSATPGTPTGPDEKVEDYDPFAYAVREDFVLLSEHQADVDRAAAAEQVLGQAETFAADEEAIDGAGQIVLGWMNVGAIYDVVPEDEKADFAEQFGSARPAGRVVLGVHALPDAVEAVGRTIDLEAGGTEALAAGGQGTGLVTDLPANTSVAFSATGLGDVAADLWDKYATDAYLDIADEADELGLKMPEDLVALLGQEAAVGTDLTRRGDIGFSATARVRTDDAERALELVDLFADLETETLYSDATPDGYVASTHREDMADAANGDLSLGDDPVFANAVPGADEASVLLFVNIVDVLAIFDDQAEGDPIPLQAFGATATGDGGNGSFTMRLTFR